MFEMVKLTKTKQALLDFLGEGYEAKIIDLEPCIYRDFGDYDLEISGGHRLKDSVTIYLWQKEDGVRIVKTVTVENKKELVANALKTLIEDYQLQGGINMSREVENITDQLSGFAMEVVTCVKEIEKQGFTKDQAIEIAKIAVEDIKAEVAHHQNKLLRELSESLAEIAASLPHE